MSEADFKTKTGNKLIPISKAYLDINNIVLDEKHNRIIIQDAFYFNELANNIQLSSSSLRNDKQLFTKLLYQMFWLVTSNPYIDKSNNRNLLEIKFWDFNYAEKPYLFEFARHIYNPSFSPSIGEYPMSTHHKNRMPNPLWHAQAQNMVEQGWIDNMDALIAEAMRRYIESHQQTISERFIREDIEWGLNGKD